MDIIYLEFQQEPALVPLKKVVKTFVVFILFFSS